MKKFARCLLILILVVIISGVGGYFYEDSTITPMYESVSKIYVVPGTDSEASIRAKDGGLNKDFMIIFSSNVVIEAAQRIAGTSEDISEYLTVTSPADSNIVELRIVNPDQNTAKTYVDAIAKTAVKTTTIIPVESMQILSEGTNTGVAFKPDLYRNTIVIVGMASAVCIFIELVVCLILCAFKKKEDHSDDEYEYEARFGRYVYPRQELIDSDLHRLPHSNTKKASSDDILAAFDDDDDDDENIDFLTKNVVNKHEETFKKEAAVARESVPEPILSSGMKIEPEAVSKHESPIKVEYEPEAKEEAEPEVKVETEPEVKAEPEVEEAKVDVDVIAKIIAEESKVEAEPEVKVEAEPEIKVEPEEETKAEDVISEVIAEEPVVEAEAEVEAEPEVKVEAEPEIKVEPEEEAKAEDVISEVIAEEPVVEAEVEVEPEVKVETEPEIKVEPEEETKAEDVISEVVAEEPVVEAEVEAEPEVKEEAEPEIKPEPEAEETKVEEDAIAKAFAEEPVAEAEVEAEPEVKEEAEPEIKPEPEAEETKAEEDVIAKAFAEEPVAEAEAEVEAEPEVKTEAEVEPEPEIVTEPEPVFNVKILGRIVK